MKFLKTLAVIGLFLSCAVVTACDDQQAKAQQPNKVTQAQKAREAANSITFTENAEIDNIKKRLELTSQPGLLGYAVLMNEAGQPVWYGAVKGKITSGSKRLTDPQVIKQVDGGYQKTNSVVVTSPSDEGTFGSSGEYIFFWTPGGQFIQWNGKYLYSDQPFRLSIKPLVVEVSAAEVK